jgi:hypothetical protein
VPALAAAAAPAAPKAKATPEDVSGDEIDSWLLGEGAGASADQPTAVYGGDTITITAFKDASAAAKPPSSASDDEYERQPADEAETVDQPISAEEEVEEEIFDEESEDLGMHDEEEEEAEEEVLEEFMDESNPFYAAKKALKEGKGQTGPAKPSFKDTSDAASDILRRLMERRKELRSS